MALTFQGIPLQQPARGHVDTQALFADLASAYSIDSRVVKFMLDTSGLATYDDFVHLFADESEVPEYIAKANLGDSAPLQVARVRRAWRAMRDALGEAARLQAAHADDADLDAPLGKVDLENIMCQFWRRYHFSLPAAIEPSDSLKARISREINLRLLSVRPVSKAHSARSEAVSKGSSAASEATEASVSLVRYLAKLRTLCYAYAIVGAAPLADAPTEPESRATDPLLYVKCPLDTVMKYYYRTEERAYQVAQVDPKRVLAWLTTRDEADRTAWVEAYRGSNLTLGAVIAKVFVERESTWMVDCPPEAAEGRKRKAEDAMGSGAGSGGDKPRTVSALNNGTAICAAWNAGRWSEPCPRGELHVCNRRLRNGRACGMRNHRGMECKSKRA